MTDYQMYVERRQTLHFTAYDIPEELTGLELQQHLIEYIDGAVRCWEWDTDDYDFISLRPR